LKVRVMIAGGGTGGHLFPGIALAEEFLKRNRDCRILFVGTEKGLEAKILDKLGYALRTIDVAGIKGKGPVRTMQALLRIPKSLVQSVRIVRRFAPDLVIGVGGYASGPAVMAAHWMGVKTVLAEQNALPGLTNRILGRFVDRVFLSFPETGKWFRKEKVSVTGNPIRTRFLREETPRSRPKDLFTVLVFGGSQGAHTINRAVAAALDHLEPMRDRLKIIHQTGQGDLEEIRKAYRDKGMNAEALPFIMDMVSAYQAADLVICRAGATSIAEITAMGKAAVLIPFPHAVEDHQTRNAEVLARAGAAEMIPESELSGRRLADAVRAYDEHPERVRLMEQRSAGLGNAGAAAGIVDACLDLVNAKNKTGCGP
jgi:UDP-N-acetylglucosamine--N-acetylmuramyl-(pentapeptide) pyrophosphoryl-undecaprenol N-acetylglucosamine transferase